MRSQNVLAIPTQVFEVCSLADVNETITEWAWLVLSADIYAKCCYALIHGNYAWQLSPKKSLLSCHPVSSLDNIHHWNNDWTMTVEQLAACTKKLFNFALGKRPFSNWNHCFSDWVSVFNICMLCYTQSIETLLLVQHPWPVDRYVWASWIAGNSALVAEPVSVFPFSTPVSVHYRLWFPCWNNLLWNLLAVLHV